MYIKSEVNTVTHSSSSSVAGRLPDLERTTNRCYPYSSYEVPAVLDSHR